MREAYLRYRDERLSQELATDVGFVLFYRPLSIGIGWLLSKGSTTPTAVSIFGGLSIPAMVAAAVALDPKYALPAICVLAYLGGLIDCVDGDLARVSGRTSRLGGYIDFQIDMARWAAFYASFGLALDRLGPTSVLFGWVTSGLQVSWLVMALIAAWLRVYARSARDFLTALGASQSDAVTTPDLVVGRAWRWIYRAVFTLLIGIDGFLPFAFLAFWSLGAPMAAILLVFVLAILDVVYTQMGAVKALS